MINQELFGVILAGGLGSRMLPLTKITNKHLLPVYDKPMIMYPIQMMVDAGIKDIALVTGGNFAGDFLRLLGDGRHMGLNSLHYTYQEGEGGIAHALSLVKHITQGRSIVVLLGDNLFEKGIAEHVNKYVQQNGRGAMICVKKVKDPERFGVTVLKNQKPDLIIEKPKKPISDLAVTGLYFYDKRVFDMITDLKPSDRGELEITDVNNAYIKKNDMSCSQVKGWWTDCGTFESLYRASSFIKKTRQT